MELTSLASFLPGYFHGITEYDALLSAEQQAFNTLDGDLQQLMLNQCIQTADEKEISRREAIFGIVADPVNESLAFRRVRVLNRYALHPPYTVPYLRWLLDQLVGTGRWNLIVDGASSTFIVEMAAEDSNYFGEILVTISAIKPCHMLYSARPLISDTVRLTQEVRLSQRAYNYRLGTQWNLGAKAFVTDGQETGLIMPETPTIQSGYLNDMAAFAASDVASVLINGSITITDFDVQQSVNNIAEITYTVSSSQTNTVTSIALRNVSNTVLASASVYVPILEEAQFKHLITVTTGG